MLRFFAGRRCMHRSAAAIKDYYESLGISRAAKDVDIKKAFYELAKQYHPDVNKSKTPEDQKRAAQRFQEIAEAFETLGSEEKKRAYDVQLTQNASRVVVQSRVPGAPRPPHQRQFTDLDIDYRDFEHFQRLNRRRRLVDDYDTPEFLRSEETKRKMKEERDANLSAYSGINYKDGRAAAREKEERRIAEEVAEQQRKAKYPLPTFEQMIRAERKRSSRTAAWPVLGAVFLILCMVATMRRG